MKKLLISILITNATICLSQVGINTKNPTETLDVNGTLRIRGVKKTGSNASAKDSIIVVDDGGVLERVSAKQIFDQIEASEDISKQRKLILKGNDLSSGEDGIPLNLSNISPILLLNDDSLSVGKSKNKVDLSVYRDNTDNQKLTLSGNTLTLERGGAPIELGKYLDNTDDQQLKLSENALTLERGGAPIELGKYLDNTDDQQLKLSENALTLERGGTPVELGKYLDNTDDQQLKLSGNALILERGGAPIELGKYLDNTDDQQLTLSENALTLERGGTPVELGKYLDNTDDQQLTLSENALTLERGGAAIDLQKYLDNTDQQLAYDNSKAELSLTNGGSVDLSILKNTDDQQLSLNRNSLSLERGGEEIDLGKYLDNTDDQQLTLSDNALTLEGGGAPVELGKYLDNTDNQQLTLDGSNLFLERGGEPVNLSSVTPTLSLNSNTLSVGQMENSVNLSKYLDNTDKQELKLTGNNLSLERGGEPVNLSSITPALSLIDNTLSIGEQPDNSLDLSKYIDNTDKQKLSYDNTKNKLTLTNGGQVDLSELKNTITNFNYNPKEHNLTLSLQNGGTKVIDLSTLATPVGTIIMWSGNINSLPKGWVLCDGKNGAPDLRNRFIVGAGSDYNIGNTGGQKQVTLTTEQIPAHSHNGQTDEAGLHNHTYKDTLYTEENNYGKTLGVDGVDYLGKEKEEDYGRNRNAHTDINGREVYAHYRRVTTSSGGSHRHTFTTNETGGGKPHENRPPYYALAFVMFNG